MTPDTRGALAPIVFGRCRNRLGRLRATLSEVILLSLVLLAFTRLHAAAGTDVAQASANALALQSVEHGLHLDIELATNHRLTEHEILTRPAVLVYRLHHAVLLGVVIWVFLGHPDVYLRVRRTFVAMPVSR